MARKKVDKLGVLHKIDHTLDWVLAKLEGEFIEQPPYWNSTHLAWPFISQDDLDAITIAVNNVMKAAGLKERVANDMGEIVMDLSRIGR